MIIFAHLAMHGRSVGGAPTPEHSHGVCGNDAGVTGCRPLHGVALATSQAFDHHLPWGAGDCSHYRHCLINVLGRQSTRYNIYTPSWCPLHGVALATSQAFDHHLPWGAGDCSQYRHCLINVLGRQSTRYIYIYIDILLHGIHGVHSTM